MECSANAGRTWKLFCGRHVRANKRHYCRRFNNAVSGHYTDASASDLVAWGDIQFVCFVRRIDFAITDISEDRPWFPNFSVLSASYV
jgi:hypothetical protein